MSWRDQNLFPETHIVEAVYFLPHKVSDLHKHPFPPIKYMNRNERNRSGEVRHLDTGHLGFFKSGRSVKES